MIKKTFSVFGISIIIILILNAYYKRTYNKPLFADQFVKFVSSVFPSMTDIEWKKKFLEGYTVAEQTAAAQKMESEYVRSFSKFSTLPGTDTLYMINDRSLNAIEKNFDAFKRLVQMLPDNISHFSRTDIIFYKKISYNSVRKLSKALWIYSEYCLKQREYQQAYEALKKCFVLSFAISKGQDALADTTSYAIGRAVEGVAIEASRPFLKSRLVPKKLKYTLGKDIENVLSKRKTVDQWINDEESIGAAYIRYVRSHSPVTMKFLDIKSGYPEKQWKEIFDVYRTASELGYPDGADLIEKKLDLKTITDQHFIINLTLPNANKLMMNTHAKEAQLKMLSIALQLSAKRRLPDDLNEFKKIAIDPFSKKQFIYNRKQRKITIDFKKYSKYLGYQPKESDFEFVF